MSKTKHVYNVPEDKIISYVRKIQIKWYMCLKLNLESVLSGKNKLWIKHVIF